MNDARLEQNGQGQHLTLVDVSFFLLDQHGVLLSLACSCKCKCVKELPALAMGTVAGGRTRLPCSSPCSTSLKVLGKVHRVGDPKPVLAVFACIMIIHTQQSPV